MSRFCDYSVAYVLVKGTMSVANTADIEVIVLHDCISKINNTQVDNAKDIDLVMPMYNLIE